jgi:hypothetical protein
MVALDGIMDAGNALTTMTWGGSLIYGFSIINEIPQVAATTVGLSLIGLGSIRTYKLYDQR